MSIDFNIKPQSVHKLGEKNINIFSLEYSNIDIDTVESFGREWTKFNYFSDREISNIAKSHYFDIVPESYLSNKSILDIGCGTGRWSRFVSDYAKSVDRKSVV